LDLHAPVKWYITEGQVKSNDDRKLCYILRGSLDPADYRQPVMASLFLKRLNDTFEENAENLSITCRI
jgi:hypothetical protein